MNKECSVDGCTRPSWARGWCNTHYARARANGGDPGGAAFRVPAHTVLEQWVASRDRSIGCWTDVTWEAAVKGYPSIWVGDSSTFASHYVLRLDGFERPSPQFEALHSCDNPPCVNPAHLHWGTRRENMLEKWDRIAVLPKTTEPCPVCGLHHRDHAKHLLYLAGKHLG